MTYQRITRRQSEPHREVERAALAVGAVHADLAAHRLDQPLRDRQPEAGASEAPRRGAVSLHERLKQRRLDIFGDADAGVLDADAESRSVWPVRLGRGPHSDLAGRRELDGVVDEVTEHLAEPARIARDSTGTSDASSTISRSRFAWAAGRRSSMTLRMMSASGS